MTRSDSDVKTIWYNTDKYKYFITIHKHQVKDYVDKSMLDGIISKLKFQITDLNVHEYTYETSGHYKQLHFHGIVSTKRSVFYKNNSKVDGYRIMWKRVYDLNKLRGYIHKQAYNKYEQENILVGNQYKNHFGFI